MGYTEKRLTVYSFKELVAAGFIKDPTEEQAYLAYRSQKRRRMSGEASGNGVGESVEVENQEQLDEVLDMQQRMKKKATMRRIKSKIQLGRKRAAKKRANPEKLKKRAARRARAAMFKKLAQGKSKGDMSMSDRKAIEKRLESKKGVIQRMAKKLLPTVRKDDQTKRHIVRDNH